MFTWWNHDSVGDDRLICTVKAPQWL
jgi:hypothetical protein